MRFSRPLFLAGFIALAGVAGLHFRPPVRVCPSRCSSRCVFPSSPRHSPAAGAAFEGGQLDAVLQVVGGSGPAGGSSPVQLAPGSTTVAFMWLALAGQSHVPSRLRHRLVTTDSEAQVAAIGLRRGLRKRAVVALFENAPRSLLPLLDRLLESHP